MSGMADMDLAGDTPKLEGRRVVGENPKYKLLDQARLIKAAFHTSFEQSSPSTPYHI